MIRRISKNNDLKDLIKSCPSGVIDDIYSIRYYIDGHSSIEIEPYFSKVNNHLEVVIPSSMLQSLHNGVLMRRALYRVADPAYPDGYYDMEFIDEMDVWLGDDEEDEEYLTPQDLKTINGMSIVGVGNIEISAVVPDYYATKSWVSEQGYVTSTALSGYATEEYVTTALSSYATESWVSAQGYLSSIPEGYATEAWVTSQGYITSIPSEYATQSWVESQAYITSEALSGYATESWVSAQGFLTSETLPSDIATQSWVAEQGYVTSSELSGYAEKDDKELEPLYDKDTNDKGYLKYNFLMAGHHVGWIDGDFVSTTYGARAVFNINGDVIGFTYRNLGSGKGNGMFYKFNRDTFTFDPYVQGIGFPSTDRPLWAHPNVPGFIVQGLEYLIDWDPTSENFGRFIQWNHQPDQNGDYVTTYYSVYLNSLDNRVYTDNHLYVVAPASGKAFIFDENGGDFTTSVPCSGISDANFFRSHCYYEGKYLYLDSSDNMYEFVEHFTDGEVTSVEFVLQSTPSIPITGIEGEFKLPFVNKYTVGNESFYGFARPSGPAYKLVNGAWVQITDFTFEGGGSTQSGCVSGALAFGYGYDNKHSGYIPIFNWGDTQEIYGWDNSVDTRLTALEQGYGDALSITNEILG